MIKILSFIGVTAAVGVAALLFYANGRPDVLRVERSVHIAASAETIHPLINDMHRFNSWNPYNRKDPAMKASYRGPASGPGAAYDFEGNGDIGAGTISIIEPSAPGVVSMKLDMTRPMEAHNFIDFRLVPQGSSTQVTWSMHCTNTIFSKLAGLVFNMDNMIGRDFEAGLASLKALAEQRQTVTR